MSVAHLTPPDPDAFAQLAKSALDSLPDSIRSISQSLEIHIQDLPDDDMLKALNLDHPYELTGLYVGVDLMNKSITDPSPHMDRVYLFRLPILIEWVETGNLPLGELVTHVLVHEIGHHFGFSDDDMHRIEDQD